MTLGSMREAPAASEGFVTSGPDSKPSRATSRTMGFDRIVPPQWRNLARCRRMRVYQMVDEMQKDAAARFERSLGPAHETYPCSRLALPRPAISSAEAHQVIADLHDPMNSRRTRTVHQQQEPVSSLVARDGRYAAIAGAMTVRQFGRCMTGLGIGRSALSFLRSFPACTRTLLRCNLPTLSSAN